jgi:hypothetical protein
MQQRSFFLETKDSSYIYPIPFAARFQLKANSNALLGFSSGTASSSCHVTVFFCVTLKYNQIVLLSLPWWEATTNLFKGLVLALTPPPFIIISVCLCCLAILHGHIAAIHFLFSPMFFVTH